MDWTTLVATLLGAAIATGTSLLAEARKDSRDAAAELRRTRREMYAAFLVALAKSRSELLTLSKTPADPDGTRDERARQIFAPCYEVRHQLELCASHEVVEPARLYFRSVRALRDLVARGDGSAHPGWISGMTEAKSALEDVRRVMRADIAPAGR